MRAKNARVQSTEYIADLLFTILQNWVNAAVIEIDTCEHRTHN